MASLSLKNVNKKYPNGFHAVKDFNMEIADSGDAAGIDLVNVLQGYACH